MVEAAQHLTDAIGEGAFAGDAHALLVAVYKNPAHDWDLRVDAAKAAVRYEKPALASTTLEVRDPLAALTTESIEALHRIALAAAASEQDHQ